MLENVLPVLVEPIVNYILVDISGVHKLSARSDSISKRVSKVAMKGVAHKLLAAGSGH